MDPFRCAVLVTQASRQRIWRRQLSCACHTDALGIPAIGAPLLRGGSCRRIGTHQCYAGHMQEASVSSSLGPTQQHVPLQTEAPGLPVSFTVMRK